MVGLITNEYIIIYTYLIIFASKDVEIKKILKITFSTLLTLLILCIAKYVIDSFFTEVPIIYRTANEPRFTFYLNHPNMVAGLILWLSAQYLYLRYDKIKVSDYIIVFIISTIFYKLTLSRTAYATSIILLILIAISKFTIMQKILKYFAKYIFIFLAIITIGLGYLYKTDNENAIINKIDKVFSYRISLLSIAIDQYNVSLVPRRLDLTEEIKWDSGRNDELYLDSLYARTYIKYGIIYLAWLAYIFTNLINKKTENKDSVFIILFAIVAVMERYMLLPIIGFPLLFFKNYIFEESEKKKKKVVFSQYIKNNLNAGPKAKVDIEKILSTDFNFDTKTIYIDEETTTNIFKRILNLIYKKIYVDMNYEDIELALIQAPFTNKQWIMKKLKNKIVLIHDIEGLRNQDEKTLEDEINFYKSCDYIIVHNEVMKDFLVNKGIEKEKIYVIELFDYICEDTETKNRTLDEKNPIIVYTGNIEKAKFINDLTPNDMKFKINFYGTNGENVTNKNIINKGAYLPDELPSKIEGNLGLVWDGAVDESDEDISFKKYTKYNNPHKLSCYISSGLPVIVWKKSAVAQFVEKYNIGYTISNIYEINKINLSDYNEKLDNVLKLKKKVQNGYFTKKVVKNILNNIDKCEKAN